MTRRLVLPLLLFAVLPAHAQQPTKRPMTFNDLMAMKRVSDPQISPSGKWVLYSVTDVSLEKNTKTNHLWIVPLDGAQSEHQVTTGKGESGGRFSPDGKHIAWTSDDADGTSQIFLASWNDADGSVGAPTPLTHITTGADGAIWSPDSQYLLVVSSVYPECSTAEGIQAAKAALSSPAAYLAARLETLQPPAKSGQLSPMITAGLHPAAWSEEAACNKEKDDAAAKNPSKAQIWDSLLYRHWDHFTGEKRSHIVLISATKGTPVRDLTPASNVGTAEVPTFSLGGPIGYAWSPDSKEIAYVANLDQVPATSTNNDVFTLRIDDSTATREAQTPSQPQKISTSPGSDDAPQYSPDGKYIAFRSQARNGFESDRFRLVLYDRQKKSIQDLLPKWDNWVDEFRWGPRSAVILFTGAEKGESPIRVVAVEEHTPGEHQMRALPDLGEFSDLQISKNYTIVATNVKVDRPAEVLKIESPPPDAQGILPGQQRTTQLTHANDQLLSELDLRKMEPFWFTSAGGVKVEGFVVRPPDFDSKKKYPLKFLIHGGPQGNWGDGWSYRWNPELMAASGYVVVMINPRGSTGYGQKFVDEVSGDWGGRPYQDLMLGLDYAEQHFAFIDKTRECALGASYGGYMADWVLTHTDRFKCIVTHDGMSDPESAFGTTEELWFPTWEFRSLVSGDGLPSSKGIGGVPASKQTGSAGTVDQTQPSYPWNFYNKTANQDPYRRWSPMQFIQNAKTPTLIVHSQRDYRLDISQGLELFTALQLRGIPSRFLYFPDEGHWVLKPRNSELWNETVSDWCDRWTHTNRYSGASPTH